MKSNRHVPLILGVLALGIAAYLAIEVGGIWAIGGAAVLSICAVPSLKTALFASEREVRELTDSDLKVQASADTIKKFEDRI